MSEKKLSLPENLNELMQLSQWVCCTLAPMPDGKLNKIPYNPATGSAAKAGDPGTWGTFPQASAAIEAGRYKVPGFEFATDGPYMGIDLDHVINTDTGEIHPVAISIIRAFDSYTEYSPSMTGFHIIIKADPAAGIFTGKRNKESPIDLEMYNKERYFTVTGNVFLDKPIEERTAVALEYSRQYIRKETPPPAPAAVSLPVGSFATTSAPLGDSELLRKMFDSQKGAEIRALFDGDLSAYGNDHSRADQALANHLAYWTNGNAPQMDRLFRQSGLYASQKIENGIRKWDKRHGQQTYGNATIQKALANFTAYVPQQRVTKAPEPTASPSAGDLAIHTVEPQPEQQPAPDFQMQTGPEMLDSFFEDVQTRMYEPLPTGITDIDAALDGGFMRQQLVTLGAAPGAGKTALAQWIFEGMATKGIDCIFLNLEMSRNQVIARSLARVAAKNGHKISSIKALRGYSWTPEERAIITEAFEEYKRTIAQHLVYNPDALSSNLDNILAFLDHVADKAEAEGKKAPLIILDYLQIVTGRDHEDGTELIKRAVKALKDHAVRHNTVVFLIIAHNRESNRSGNVTMESGRDTSAIEYSGDTQIGLTFTRCLSDWTDEYGIKHPKVSSPDALSQADRKWITLKIVKSRFGGIGRTVDLRFDGETMTYTQTYKDFKAVPDKTPFDEDDGWTTTER